MASVFEELARALWATEVLEPGSRRDWRQEAGGSGDAFEQFAVAIRGWLPVRSNRRSTGRKTVTPRALAEVDDRDECRERVPQLGDGVAAGSLPKTGGVPVRRVVRGEASSIAQTASLDPFAEQRLVPPDQPERGPP